MKNFSTWMILSLAVIFWILRVFPLEFNTEISLLFIALISFILIAKRKWLGAIIYAVSYELYFGVDLVNSISKMDSLSMTGYTNMMFSFFGMILPITVLLDLALDKNRKAHPKDKKTDWFYRDEKYDRNMDERADKNNYRTL